MTTPASISAVPTCAGCIFGAISSTTITPAYHAIETIVVEVTPFVTIFNNGSTTTSWSNHTKTNTVFVNNATQTTENVAGPTFSDIDDLIWTYGNTTLSYGTTYVQYLRFEAATGSINGEDRCADQSDATTLMLPTDADEASLVYPYTAGAGLPAQLLDYLESLPTVAAQIGGQDLDLCAPLTTAAPSPIYTTLAQNDKRFQGARRELGVRQAGISGGNYTFSGNSTSPANSTSSGNATLPVGGPPETETQYTSATSRSTSGRSYKSIAPQPETGTASFSPAPFASTPQNVHTTAFVISRATASGFTYTESAGTVDSVVNGGTAGGIGGNPDTAETRLPNSAASQKPEGSNESDSEEQPPVTEPSEAGATQDVSGLVGAIGAAATQAQTAASPATTAQPTQQNTAAPMFYVGNTVVFANSDTMYPFAGQILTPGQTVTIEEGRSEKPVALQTNGGTTQLVVDGTTYIGAVTSQAPTPSAVITASGGVLGVSQSDGYVVLLGSGGATNVVLTPGSQTTLDGVAISALPDGKGAGVVVSGKTILPAGASGEASLTGDEHIFTAVQTGDSILLADGASTITLAPGATTTLDGNSVSAGQGGTIIAVGGETYTLSVNAATTSQHLIRVNGHTFTVFNGEGSLTLQNGTSTITVRDGEQTTFEGETVSALSAGNGLVIDTSITTTFGPRSSSVGDYIEGGINALTTSEMPASTGGNSLPTSGGTGMNMSTSMVWRVLCTMIILMLW